MIVQGPVANQGYRRVRPGYLVPLFKAQAPVMDPLTGPQTLGAQKALQGWLGTKWLWQFCSLADNLRGCMKRGRF